MRDQFVVVGGLFLRHQRVINDVRQDFVQALPSHAGVAGVLRVLGPLGPTRADGDSGFDGTGHSAGFDLHRRRAAGDSVDGMVTLIWYTPTNCGDNPAKVTGAETPAIVTVGVVTTLRRVSSELLPVVAGGFTAPKPLPHKTSESPGVAGWLAMPGIAPVGAASEPSGLTATA
jgi:hypothetical protein